MFIYLRTREIRRLNRFTFWNKKKTLNIWFGKIKTIYKLWHLVCVFLCVNVNSTANAVRLYRYVCLADVSHCGKKPTTLILRCMTTQRTAHTHTQLKLETLVSIENLSIKPVGVSVLEWAFVFVLCEHQYSNNDFHVIALTSMRRCLSIFM